MDEFVYRKVDEKFAFVSVNRMEHKSICLLW